MVRTAPELTALAERRRRCFERLHESGARHEVLAGDPLTPDLEIVDRAARAMEVRLRRA